MRVLMFGWEFPPFITGGLGTACYGLTQELSKITSRILFVIPRVSSTSGSASSGASGGQASGTERLECGFADEFMNGMSRDAWGRHSGTLGFGTLGSETLDSELLDSADVADFGSGASQRAGAEVDSFLSKVQTVAIDSPLRPYGNAKDYEGRFSGPFRQRAFLPMGSGVSVLAPSAQEARGPGHDPGSHASQGPVGQSFGGGASSSAQASKPSLSTHYGANLFEEVRRYARMASRYVARDHFDVIHAHDWMTFAAGVAAKRASGRPLVVHVHALEFDRAGENIDQRVYEVERFGMENADLVVAVSHRTRQTIIKRYGIDPARVRVLHNGILDLPPGVAIRKHPIFEEKIVVFLGRVTMQKGPEYFIDAAARVAKVFPRVRFVMAGTGDLLPEMMLRIARHRLNRCFHFTGFVSEAERSELLSRAHLFVMTSVSEPFGLTPVEAAQHEVPLIIPVQSGVAEVLHHAIKVDFWDTDRIADAMIHILSSPQLAHQMVEATKSEMQHASWARAAEILRGYYQEVI